MSKLRKSAKNQRCQIRIPDVCRDETETVCLCHLNGAGWGMKSLDIHGAYGCLRCHSVVDGGPSVFPKDLIKLWFLEGVIRTQEIMVKEKLIKY
jgi:hypothetical protein